MRRFADHKDMFISIGDKYLLDEDHDFNQTISIEELYQHFKARMLGEVAVTSDELLHYAELIET